MKCGKIVITFTNLALGLPYPRMIQNLGSTKEGFMGSSNVNDEKPH